MAYTGFIVEIKELREHSNADNLRVLLSESKTEKSLQLSNTKALSSK